ncbi:hypothetical protein FRACYDRAFT_257843 [Fragilariopsis cylindrus CCMP1102]|uniref:Uncharacterized protein n=1 Tax=Fragilariopsis cylindrus CCMP1102 TaxID=635003 RepID=A0A1E7EIY6_9STRA|nr:hypothetical protein FRACYDRAFT_257843 [Fragilariopsis cylindrus CCMP1102]|eukprot:OEU05854.1 hypothetical protein FRACYDRAFT_257843 [Fragilariopsis cylindrus CCMP1102]
MKLCISQIIILALTITTRSVIAATSSLRGPSFGNGNSNGNSSSNNHNDGLIVDPQLHVEHGDDAPLPPSSSTTIGWKLRSIRQIDTLPGGKYTQIRIIPNNSKAIIAYNGMNADGIQLVSCEDAECNNLTIPRTIHNTDPNPRYIRMELSLETSLPTLVYSAEGGTQMKLTVCLSVECTGTKSIILYGQEQEQHNKITVRTNDIVFLRSNNNNKIQKKDQKDNLAAVVFGISNPIDGCKLILAQIQITTSSTKGIFTAGLEFPAIIESNNNNIDEKDKNGNDVHIAYWDVVNRQLVMIFNALSSKGGEQQQQRKDVIVMSNTTNTSNPGSFVKILRQPPPQQEQERSDGVLWLTFYDLILGKMYMVQCNEIKEQCMEPYIIDSNIGDRTLANYGGGGFPSTYNIVDGDDGAAQSRPTILEAYFNNNYAESTGQLKLLELTPTAETETEIEITTNTHTKENAAVESKSANNNRNEVTTATTTTKSNDIYINVIAEGKQGFGRDSSMAYYHRRHDDNNSNNNSNSNNNDNDLLFISLLDLQGIDTPETQVAKLAIFERISFSTQQEEEKNPTRISL